MADPADLQFDKAEFAGAPAGTACAVCKTALFGSYFDVNGQPVCEACCYRVREEGTGGSRVGRVTRAAAAGVAAALGGAILYWAILALTGYEFGLIAIVVGLGVGKAVSWGSGGRGGWAYQTLAIVLTYLAIVSAYVPMLVKEIVNQPAVQAESVQPGEQPAAAVPQDTAAPEAPAGVGTMFIAVGLLLAIACAAPFLAGVQNIIGLVIIGIGLYEAWKLNRRRTLVITGPHALAVPGHAALAP